jgi:hypothetical protein
MNPIWKLCSASAGDAFKPARGNKQCLTAASGHWNGSLQIMVSMRRSQRILCIITWRRQSGARRQNAEPQLAAKKIRFTEQRRAASAIESHFKDKAHLAALAFKTFGNVSYQQYNQQRAVMSQAWNEDEEALEPKALVSADPDCEPGINFPQMWCARTVRRAIKSAGKYAGIRMLEPDGSPVAVGDFYMVICKGLVLNGKDCCLAEINGAADHRPRCLASGGGEGAPHRAEVREGGEGAGSAGGERGGQ